MIPATEMDEVKEVLVKLQRQKALRQWGTVMAALRKEIGVSETVATEYLEAMIGRGVEVSASGRMVTICLDGAPRISEGEEAWRQTVLMRSDFTESELAAMFSLWSAISDWPGAQYDSLIDELLWIRQQPLGQTLYLTSASGRLASSKLLSTLPKAALRGLGITIDTLPTAPICFLIAGSLQPDAVVLVENPNAFERAIAATADLPIAWISAYGFGASALDAGERLIDGLENPTTICAVRTGNPPSLQSLLHNSNLFFWGDLDVAGLQIFQRARVRLPTLQLSALYRPMLTHLANGGGHPYTDLTGKATQRVEVKCCEPALLPLFDACRSRAIDQEWLQANAIRTHCLYPLIIQEGS